MRLPTSFFAQGGLKLGCAVFLVCVAAAIASSAQTLTTLAIFKGKQSPLGDQPVGPLVQGLDGNLYGVTIDGGLCNWSCGTFFKITPSGTLTTLYSFCTGNTGCPNRPFSGLTLAIDGTFYGTTLGYAENVPGSIFQITPGGGLTVLDTFNGSNGVFPNGAYPEVSPLLQAMNGNFYGEAGGGAYGWGTIFETTSSGTLTALYSFCPQPGCTDGSSPVGGLVQAPSGIIYGTAAGGTNALCDSHGCGTVFRITSAGKLTTLYNFCAQTGCSDGAFPSSGLIQAVGGSFYGTTSLGGTGLNICGDPGNLQACGTVFSLTVGGSLTTLYSFCTQTGCPDGAGPSGLVQATDGNFYGTAGQTIFKITPQGTLTTLYTFCVQAKCPDGSGPEALLQATDGNFYGVTLRGGGSCDATTEGCGTVFKFSTGLAPFVKTLPTIGKVGAAVTILGTDLTGATAVTFHGIAATFTVVSSSEITTIVPAGATTGKVKVTTPSGTLTSNVAYTVQP